MGALKIYVKVDCDSTEGKMIWSKEGCQGAAWAQGSVTIDSSKKFKVGCFRKYVSIIGNHYMHKLLDNGNGALCMVPSQLGFQLDTYPMRTEIQDGGEVCRIVALLGKAIPESTKRTTKYGARIHNRKFTKMEKYFKQV